MQDIGLKRIFIDMSKNSLNIYQCMMTSYMNYFLLKNEKILAFQRNTLLNKLHRK